MSIKSINYLIEKYPLLKQSLIILGNSTLILIAVYSSFGAVISAFSLNADMSVLFFIWFLSSIAVSTLAFFYRGKGILVLLIPVSLLVLLVRSDVINGAMRVIYEISSIYSTWLPSAVIFPQARELPREPMIILAVTGIAISMLLAIAICLRRSVFTAIMVTLPIVALTFVITDYRSDLIYLFGVIAVYIALFFTNAYSPDNFVKRDLAIFPAIIFAILFMFVTHVIVPNDTYVRSDDILTLSSRMRSVLQTGRWGNMWQGTLTRYSWIRTGDGIFGEFNTNSINVAQSGGLIITNNSLLDITVDHPGTFYIRGFSMQYFDGQSWMYSDEIFSKQDYEAAREIREENYFAMLPFANDDNVQIPDDPDESILLDIARAMPAFIAQRKLILNIYVPLYEVEMSIKRTGDITSNVIYHPYYGLILANENGVLSVEENTDNFIYIPGSFIELAQQKEYLYYTPGNPLDRFAELTLLRERFTQIDEYTAQGLRQHAINAGIDLHGERYEVVDAVASYIKSSGVYTLMPGIIPEGENFALYFLQSLNEGYCIHFATAAVLMLRALDIPARFTTGYVVTVPRDEINRPVILTDRNAHAWVEVFYEDIGWLYLEVTPGSALSGIPETRPHTPANNTLETQTAYPDDFDDILIFPPVEATLPAETGEPESGDIGTGEISDQNDRTMSSWINSIIIVVICIAMIVIMSVIRIYIKRNRRIKLFEQNNSNAAVICMWQYIQRLHRKDEDELSADIEALALKARFSQHSISKEEQAQLIEYTSRFVYKIYNASDIYRRFWLKYILALY